MITKVLHKYTIKGRMSHNKNFATYDLCINYAKAETIDIIDFAGLKKIIKNNRIIIIMRNYDLLCAFFDCNY
jgi:hypothetical protein